MSNAEDDDEKKPFQLRAFPVATRKLAIACAARAGLTVPEWIDRAVHAQARIDRAESVFPPERPGLDDAALLPVSRVSDEISEAAHVAGLTSGQLLERLWQAWQAGGQHGRPDPAIADLAALLTAVGSLPEHIPLPGQVRALINHRAQLARGVAPSSRRPKQAAIGTDAMAEEA